MKTILFSIYNSMPFFNWKFAKVTKAWKEELNKGMGGIGQTVRVWKDPFNFDDQLIPLWLLHPKSHYKMLKLCDVNPSERYPFFLNNAIKIYGG